eukprot:scaffold1720_cov238-Pinguiococcus_pyrenoidosus.AAC.14
MQSTAFAAGCIAIQCSAAYLPRPVLQEAHLAQRAKDLKYPAESAISEGAYRSRSRRTCHPATWWTPAA